MKLFLIDAYALIFKFYYAFISRPMRNKDGLNTSAIFGFSKFINDIISSECPDYLGVAFDVGGGTFRHELFPDYKGNRSATPEDIIASTPHIKRILEAMGIPVLEMKGYEADDIIGTMSRCGSEAGFEVYMVTPDKDYAQLIKPNVFMYKPAKSGSGVQIVGMDNVEEMYGVKDPKLVIDILALWGDASDNIPGVPGIGEKGAIKLVNQFGTVENIIENVAQIKGRAGQNIAAGIEQLNLSKRLTTIVTDMPMEFCADKLKVSQPNYPLLRELYLEMGFNTLLPTLDFWQRCYGQTTPTMSSSEVAKKEESTEETNNNKSQQDLFSSPQPDLFSQGIDLFSSEVKVKNVETTNHTYSLVSTIEDVDKLVAMARMHPIVCFDTETTSLNCMVASLVGISIAVEPHKAYYIALYPHDRAKTLEFLEHLKPLLCDEKIAKVGQNIKYDLLVLKNYGIDVLGLLYDTMIIHYLLDSDSRHGMDYLADKYLGYQTIEISELIGKGARQLTIDQIEVAKVCEYSCEDADITLQLYNILWKELKNLGLEKLYLDIEEPLIRVLTNMEFEGVKVDDSILKTFGSELKGQIEEIENKIIEIAQEPININSPRQLGILLFEKLKVDAKPKKTKTKSYKTDEEYLTSLRHTHPVIDMILEYRSLKKLLSTYVETLPLLINPATGRIHSTYNQAIASTGRLSSNNPNLQNIPIRDERGKRVREAFVADGEDKTLISADYSQVELRIMAAMSGDESMLEAFNKGEDIHRATAATIYGVELDEVTTEQRRRAKTANFGIIYGISAFGLSQRLGIPRKEASDLIESYFSHYPKVKEYMDRAIEESRKAGFCTTLFGRRKQLPDISAASAIVRGYAERNAINAPIQGTAADIIKIAMAKLATSLQTQAPEAKIIMQVHDELVIEVPTSMVESVSALTKEAMESAVELAVCLEAECGVGHSWLDAH